MIEATLCFLVDGYPPARILLGHKRVGFGLGKWGGVGGKIESGETPAAAAAREVREETGLDVCEANLRYMAHLTFLFPHRPEWSQVVHVFLADCWRGEPKPSREIIPHWFAVDEIPYDQMWDDCHYWLPEVLDGHTVSAVFTFGKDNDTVAHFERLHQL